MVIELLAKFASGVEDTEPASSHRFPANLTLPNLAYFLLAPTLCYQEAFPRRAGAVRARHALSLLVRLVALACAIVVVVQQYVMPTLHEAVVAIDARDAPKALELLLVLALPVTYARGSASLERIVRIYVQA